ncbi:Cleavage and polyadenylation specificity factor subunit 3-like [Oopsacas minuta]|uniref:Cleavage and polyadenylation specificity factor subunit 3-like n=1 Tax=Oopsacas minuta TaxID=111878 RepID=A0AAV7JIJ9_9METZ|nr:Cleavage and polyadenylation specificity factor subunit 3-like [Oopsacas minuta]
MTHPTKAIYRWLLSDYIKVSNISHDDEMLYTDRDLEKSMDKIEVINYHTEIEVNGIKFQCYQAGHVLGAAMFLIEIAGVKIFYTGDFSREEDRHLRAAEEPPYNPDILIMESTYGNSRHEKRETRENRFTTSVHAIVNRGGRCLIPVFALGRAQELLLILDEYWSIHPELHDIPIYYASSLAKKCMSVYQTFLSAMNERINSQTSNPFSFKHIFNKKNFDHFDDIAASVVMASPGMMQSGLSRGLFETWCSDNKNGVIIAGYCVEGTLARQILNEPNDIIASNGKRLPLKLTIEHISFSAHTDIDGSSEFIKLLKPSQIILVHGEPTETLRLKNSLQREFEESDDYCIVLHSPVNTQSIKLSFRGEKMAKVMGRLASNYPKNGSVVSGILVKRGIKHHLMNPLDLSNYTELGIGCVKQQLSISYKGTLQLLTDHLHNLTCSIQCFQTDNKDILIAFNVISITLKDETIVIEWISSATHDLYADAILTVILQISLVPLPIKLTSNVSHSNEDYLFGQFSSKLIFLYSEIYGQTAVTVIRNQSPSIRICVKVDNRSAIIDPINMVVECIDDQFCYQIYNYMKRLHTALLPI